MTRLSHSQRNFSRRSTLTVALLSACLVGGGLAVAQTKQLKEPAQPATSSPADASAQPAPTDANGPQNFSQSYSVVVENRTDKDGKTIQTKKVWKDGQLVQSDEKTIDSAADGDATINLPNGQIVSGQVAPGAPNAIDPSTIFGGPTGSPFEMMRQMEAQMREQQEQMQAQLDDMRRQFSTNPNGPFVFPNAVGAAPSKYWIGATVEPTPEMVAAQLPLEANQGVLIQAVVPDSPCAQAGLQRFDVVVKIDGKEIANASEVGKIVDEIGAKTVKIGYYRKGELAEADLTVAERPQQFGATALGDAFEFGTPADKQFRVVRPGLIVPAPEAQDAAQDSAQTADAAQPAESATEDAAPTPAENQAPAENAETAPTPEK